ncbi:MAG: tetratricopeptide repeat protein [Cyclobacteriaceae bacterium]|nr:tetratricopeptide repeat protein [Cyclobacteriaceae bacterium]
MPKSLTLFLLVFVVNSICIAQGKSTVNKLNARSFELRSLKRDSSRILAYQALALSKSKNYLNGINQAQLNLGIHFCNLDQLDSASLYLNNAYQFWMTEQNSFYLALNNWYLGKLYQKVGNFGKAFNFLNKAEKQFETQGNKLFQLYVITEEGVYYEMQGDYTKALDFYLKAYELRELIGDMENSVQERSNIASIYARMGRFKEAKEYAKLSVDAAKKNPKAFGQLAVELRDLGKKFQMEKSYDSAIFYYRKALKTSLDTKSLALRSSIFSSLASLYNEVGVLNKANAYLLKAKQLANGLILLDIYLELSKNHQARQQTDSSLYYASKCIALGEQRGSKQHILEATAIKMEAFEHLQHYDSAFLYAKRAKQLSELIYNDKKDKRFNNLRVQLGLLEKEKEIEALKLVRYQDKVRTFRIIGGIAIILILVFVLLLISRIKHKKKQKLLEQQLAKSKHKLSSQTLSMIHRNNAFEEIELKLMDVRSRCNGNADPGLQKIQQTINLNKSLDSDWDNFSNYFSELHGNFLKHLSSPNYALSDYELRLCALIKLKLTNKEIATILNIEHNSVKMAKYRLKKKLGINENESMDDFITGTRLI